MATRRTREEIRHILVDELGFRDLDCYRRWVAERRPSVVPTPELIERLSPDSVDCRAFWRVCEELFGIDPVCNQVSTPHVGQSEAPAADRLEANRLNLSLARSLGITAFLDETAHDRRSTLEIGPGFGALRNYIETCTRHEYTGVDVFPRLPGLVEATDEGLLPPPLARSRKGTMSYVVSTNVFQHLSSLQRSRWYFDAHELLHRGGLFLFNLIVDTGRSKVRDAAGRAWVDHYGQYTLMPRAAEVQDELSRLFDILYVTQRYDGVVGFVCRKG